MLVSHVDRRRDNLAAIESLKNVFFNSHETLYGGVKRFEFTTTFHNLGFGLIVNRIFENL